MFDRRGKSVNNKVYYKARVNNKKFEFIDTQTLTRGSKTTDEMNINFHRNSVRPIRNHRFFFNSSRTLSCAISYGRLENHTKFRTGYLADISNLIIIIYVNYNDTDEYMI